MSNDICWYSWWNGFGVGWLDSFWVVLDSNAWIRRNDWHLSWFESSSVMIQDGGISLARIIDSDIPFRIIHIISQCCDTSIVSFSFHSSSVSVWLYWNVIHNTERTFIFPSFSIPQWVKWVVIQYLSLSLIECHPCISLFHYPHGSPYHCSLFCRRMNDRIEMNINKHNQHTYHQYIDVAA